MSGTKDQSVVIQERDRHLLRELSVMRVLDREQARAVAPFGSVTRANERLLKLVRAGFLQRVFIGTIAGGRRAVYSPTRQGANVAGVVSKAPLRAAAISHQLAINEVYIGLKYPKNPSPDVRLKRWRTFGTKLSPDAPIIPDACFELATPAGVESMFLEVDLGTEPLATFQKKIREYVRYAVSGEYRKLLGGSRFRVLIVTRGNRRLENLRRTTAKVTAKIFWFATLSSIHEKGLFATCWLRPSSRSLLPLL